MSMLLQVLYESSAPQEIIVSFIVTYRHIRANPANKLMRDAIEIPSEQYPVCMLTRWRSPIYELTF